jgi:hypothetical protein
VHSTTSMHLCAPFCILCAGHHTSCLISHMMCGVPAHITCNLLHPRLLQGFSACMGAGHTSCTAGAHHTCLEHVCVSCCAGRLCVPRPPPTQKGTCLVDCPLSLPTSTSVPGNTTAEDTRPALNFNGMANAILVEPTGFLLFNNVRIADFASTQAYTYTPSQPYINRGIGYGLWPSIALAPGALVSIQPGLSVCGRVRMVQQCQLAAYDSLHPQAEHCPALTERILTVALSPNLPAHLAGVPGQHHRKVLQP